MVLQLDCPGLAMSGHMLGESLEDFRARARVNVEAIGHATRDIPPDDVWPLVGSARRELRAAGIAPPPDGGRRGLAMRRTLVACMQGGCDARPPAASGVADRPI